MLKLFLHLIKHLEFSSLKLVMQKTTVPQLKMN